MPEHYELIERTGDMPQEADFCLTLEGDEMEPVIKQGSRVYVSRRESPGDMEAGVFYYRGRIYCRQLCRDYAGDIHLLCANPKRESENLRLTKGEMEKCLCLGKVLLEEKPPMPVYG